MFGARELVSYWPSSRILTGLGQCLKAGADRNGRPHSYKAREWIWPIASWLGERKEAQENIIGLVTLCFHLRRPREVPARLRIQDSACT